MAIIYTYPVATPVLDDLLLISDSNDGKKTKNITITSLKSLINTQYTLTSDQNGADVDVKLNDNTGSVVSTVKLVKGSNVTLSNSGSNITISSTGGGGGGGSVDSVTTTDGTFINLTPNGAATGAVTVTADLSATGTTDSTTFLRGDNTWNVPPDTIYSLPTATSSILGGIKLFSDTEQAISANTVSAEASRTYGLQLNSSNQAVVNIPWLNTTYSDFVGATSTTDGASGLVPQPEAGDYLNFLRGDGTWAASSAGSVTSVSTNGGLDPGTPLNAALSLTISNPTTTPNLVFQWEGASTQYVSGEGALVTFPTVDNITSFTATQTGGTDTDPNLTINDGSNFNLQVKGSGGTSVTRDSGGGFITIASTAPTATPPAGSDTQVQYNNSGSFGATDLFTYSGRILSVGKLGDTARSHLKIFGGGNDDSYLTLYCSAGTHGVTIEGPDHTGGSNYTLKLPASLPNVANQILESNASGELSWISTPSGSGGVTSFTNANGTFISAATQNTAATGSVTTGSIDLSATGTPSSSNFLRGDNTWAVPPTGGSAVGSVGDVQYRGAASGSFNASGENNFSVSASNALLKIGGSQTTINGTVQLHGSTVGESAVPGNINFVNPGGSNIVSLQCFATSTSYAITLPSSSPGTNNRILESNSSGVLQWIDTPSGGGGGGFPSAVTASSTAATSAAVDTLYTITTTGGVADIVVTLPTAASNSAKIIGVKYAAQNSVNDTVVIKTISSQTIDGTNRTTNGLPLASVGTYFELVSDGSNWWIK